MTINLTPSEVREDYLLYKRDRFIMTEERILGAIAAEGLQPSTRSLADHYAARGMVEGAVAGRVTTPVDPVAVGG